MSNIFQNEFQKWVMSHENENCHPNLLIHKTILLNIFTANLLTHDLQGPLYETIFRYTIARNCLQYFQFHYTPASFHNKVSKGFLLNNLIHLRTTIEGYIQSTGDFLKSLGITKAEWPFLYEKIDVPKPIDISE